VTARYDVCGARTLLSNTHPVVQIAIKQDAQCPGRTQSGVPSDWPIDEGARNT
jgi:hypothetical protein